MKLGDVNNDLQDLIRMYHVGPLLAVDDIRGAVQKINRIDSDEATVDFIQKYLNVSEFEAAKLFYDYTSK